MRNLFVISSLLLVLLVVLGACGDDEDTDVSVIGPRVGGPCVDILDCKGGSICAEGSDFPEGMCAVPCDDHDECPGASSCVAREGGVCLLACARDADCRNGYKCKDVGDQRGGGKSLVCIK